jgi:predicted RNase H-like HicB family nuclease
VPTSPPGGGGDVGVPAEQERTMRFEVELVKQEDGLYKASAVAYPAVTATGRTEKEALGLLMEAMGKHMKSESTRAGRGSA